MYYCSTFGRSYVSQVFRLLLFCIGRSYVSHVLRLSLFHSWEKLCVTNDYITTVSHMFIPFLFEQSYAFLGLISLHAMFIICLIFIYTGLHTSNIFLMGTMLVFSSFSISA